ncbi:unnamed protein product [Sphenostylis stenocarpa]|uniref:UDP-rhamnose:rhamnosyltransferase 1 n=1 Tax=Sphenostylis stenocarpa TaxID=92480 RepID=A0AA86SB38_9FABA|nr:unnamed protein product [Sphenostylis stenocarpa]
MAEKAIHVVMVPWSAFGHLIPFFKLSIALAKAGVRVSYVSTPRNIERLPKVPPALTDLVDFVSLPLLKLDEDLLPENAEATVDIPPEKNQYLMLAYDHLQHGVKQFVADQLPDWIICDFSTHWIVDISQEFQVQYIFFSVFPSLALTSFGAGSKRKTPISPESIRKKPSDWENYPSSASEVRDFERITTLISASQAIICRGCYEIDGEYLRAYQKQSEKPVIPIGMLPVERGIVDGCKDKIFEWLDKQASKSVLFVGFGSEARLRKDQVLEIAYGLQESELPFLWALRKPSWASDDEDFLPADFIERTSNRGVVCKTWVPQQKILAHPSIGASSFHSGWSSVIEALQFGHVQILLPLQVDQPINARFMVEKGLAIEVNKNEDGSFTGKDIARSLRQAMVSEEGKKIRSNVEEAAAIVGNMELHQGHYIAEFVQFLKSGIWKQKSS